MSFMKSQEIPNYPNVAKQNDNLLYFRSLNYESDFQII